jgi:hypothetical protein
MMSQKFIRRSLELTAEQWQVIETLASELATNAPSGPSAGRPSWRSLIKLLADGRLSIVKEHDESTDTV